LCLNYGKSELGHRHYGFTHNGAFAEYGIFKCRSLAPIPSGVTFDEATICDSAGVALNGLHKARISAGDWVAVYGPGPIGNLTAQIAKANGARTIMVGRGERLVLASQCGADVIIDYGKELDPVAEIMKITDGLGADVVVECSGNKRAFAQAVESVKRDGNVISLALYEEEAISFPVNVVHLRQVHIHGSRANPNCLPEVLRLLEQKRIDAKKLITHKFYLTEISEALDVFSNRRDGAMKVVVYP
jgi:L-iditol 2-dehydrogenase